MDELLGTSGREAMSTLSIARSDGGTRRKITVNERVERILHGALQSDEPRTASADARNEAAVLRSRQLSNLYTSSMEDRFLKARIQSEVGPVGRTDGPKSVPKNVHLARRKVTDVPPIVAPAHHDVFNTTTKQQLAAAPAKPVKCYAKFMLEQLELQEDEERRKLEAAQFRAPDFSPPKPWYKGYSSNHRAPPCTMDAKVRRYGAYGTAKMLASETASGTAPPFALHASQSLDSLAYKDAPSAWSPSLHGSPSLWPEDANFANGSKLQTHSMVRCPSPDCRFPSHVVGRMEPSPDDTHYTHMQQVHAQDARDLEAALDDEKARRCREIEYNKDKLDHWKAHLHFEPLSSKMDHPFVKVHATRAKEMTILHSPEYSPAARFNGQVEKLIHERFSLRWRNMALLLEAMKRTPCRRPVLQDIEKLLALSYEISLKNLHHLELNRHQFWELLSKEYPLVDATHANRVFSSYDCRMEDHIDMRVFLATMRAMRVQQGTPIELVTMALDDFDISKRHVVAKADHFVAVMAMCSGSDEEEQELKAQARMVWHHIVRGFAEEKEVRRQRRLRGLGEVDEDSGGAERDTEPLTEDEAQSEIESLLFVGRDDEPHAVPIKFIRTALSHEKDMLRRFTEVLIRRREECLAMVATTAPKPRLPTAVREGAGRRDPHGESKVELALSY